MNPKQLLRQLRQNHRPATSTHRQTARQIQHNHPGWQVSWSSRTRRYWAHPTSSQRQGPAVSATCPHRLTTRMTTTTRCWRTQHPAGHAHRAPSCQPAGRR
jgi:hypothetical protein